MAGKKKQDPESAEEEEAEEPMQQGSDDDAPQSKSKPKERKATKHGEPEDEIAIDEEREKRRETRKKYRTLQAQVDETRTNLRDVSVSTMLEQVSNANELFKGILRPAEAVLDSHVLMAASDAGALKVRQLKVDADAFDSEDFLVKLVQFLGGRVAAPGKGKKRKGAADEEEDELEEDEAVRVVGGKALKWEKAGKVLGRYSKRVPVIDFMYGPLDIEVKAKKAVVRQAKNKIDPSQIVRPEEIQSGDITKDPQETTKMVASIAKVLLDYGDEGLPLLAFIMNPDSFAQSVENMFYFSFLVREGKVAIEFEENEASPYYEDAVCFGTDPATFEDIANGGKKHQLIFELTQEVWQGAIDAYGIKKSVIPTRAEVKAPAKGGKGWH